MNLLTALLAVGLAIGATPQSRPPLNFTDVVIRESDAAAGARGGAEFLPSGDVSAARQTLRQLIARAYGVRDYDVVDVPESIAEARFDISARAPEAASALDGPDMLRRLLTERFGVTVRTERRKREAYALERAGRSLGRRLNKASARCTPMPGTAVEATRATATGANECTTAMGWNGNTIFIRQSPIATLVRLLESELGQTVIDRTGLSGKYDADVFSPGVGPGGAKPSTRPPDDPLLVAVREQLNLKLELTTVEFEAVKVVSARRP